MISDFIASVQTNISVFFDIHLSKILSVILLLMVWVCVSILVYLLIRYIFKKFKILDLIDKLEMNSEEKKKEKKEKKKALQSFGKKVKLDVVIAKSISYYIFLLFFRYAIVIIGITDIEDFLSSLIAYLPSLFIGIVIWFLGIRFANFIYEIVYHTLNLSKQKIARIIAASAKIIILFFTLMLVLDYTKIVDQTVINTILIWFISMITLAWGLAFGLGWKDIAKEILESLKK